mgnify:CR=1 FL=1
MKKSFLCARCAGRCSPDCPARHGLITVMQAATTKIPSRSKGTVVQLVMVNPHALIVFDVNDGGKTTAVDGGTGRTAAAHQAVSAGAPRR